MNVNNIYIAAANCQVALAFVKMASVEAGWEAGRDFGFARQLVRKPAAASPRPKIAQANTLLGEAGGPAFSLAHCAGFALGTPKPRK